MFWTAEKLNAEQSVAKVGASFDSVRDTLVHTMSAEHLWLARCQEIESPAMLRYADYPDVRAVRENWSAIEMWTQTFVTSIDEPQLARLIHYVNAQAEPNAYPLWQILVHQVIHATQHRSEVAGMLTQFGHSPGWLDFLIFFDSNQVTAHNASAALPPPKRW